MTDAVVVDAEAPPVEPEKVETEDKPERPPWLPSQFETPAALASSYKSAQQKITSQGQQLSELTHENAQLTAELEALLEARHVMEDRVAVLERGLLQRLVGRRPGA